MRETSDSAMASEPMEQDAGTETSRKELEECLKRCSDEELLKFIFDAVQCDSLCYHFSNCVLILKNVRSGFQEVIKKYEWSR